MSPRPRNPSRHLAKPPGASCLSLSLSSHNQSSKPQPFSFLSPVVHPPPSTTPPPTQPHAYKTDDCPRTCTTSSSHLRPRPTPDANQRPSLSNHVGSLRARKVRLSQPPFAPLQPAPHRTATYPTAPLSHTSTHCNPASAGEAHSAASHRSASHRRLAPQRPAAPPITRTFRRAQRNEGQTMRTTC